MDYRKEIDRQVQLHIEQFGDKAFQVASLTLEKLKAVRKDPHLKYRIGDTLYVMKRVVQRLKTFTSPSDSGWGEADLFTPEAGAGDEESHRPTCV